MALLWSRGCAVFFAMVIRVIFVLGIPPRVAQSAGSPEFRAHHSTSLGRPRSFLNTASGEVFAQDHLKNLFHWAYYWGGVYCENYCFDNVERLLAIFLDKSPSLRANDFTVLFIEPARTIGFKALKARNGFQRDLPTEGPSNPFLPIFYYFHVALVHQGLVYDLDYGHTPQVVTLGAYVRRQAHVSSG